MRKQSIGSLCTAMLAWITVSGCVTSSTSPTSAATTDATTADSGVAADGSTPLADGAVLLPDGAVVAADGAPIDTAKPEPPGPVIDLVVDANRDGVVKPGDPNDQGNEEVFNDKFGAIFLPNLDDDDGDHLEDFYDEVINGEGDTADLATILLQPWKEAPDGTKGKLTVDVPAKVRIWARTADGSWVLLLGSFGNCDKAENCSYLNEFEMQADWLRSGLELRIEGSQLRMSQAKDAWSGDVELTLTVTDAAGAPVVTKTAPAGSDTVRMRVAAWLNNGNTSEFDKWRSLRFGASSTSAVFNKDLDTAEASMAGLAKYVTYEANSYADRWTQDFYQTGVVQMPGPIGKPQGFRMFNARPFANAGGQGLPIAWMRKALLGPDQAILAVYKKANSGSSYDSHGNHDLIPPYKTATADFKYGRIVTGSGVLPETWDWYDAQRAQGPTLKLNSSWLIVGHIDEFLSYYPAKTKRGWKLMVGSNAMAKQMFEKAQADGNGGAKVFVGRTAYNSANQQIKMEQTVDDVLKNAEILQWSQEAEVKVAENIAKIKPELELGDDEMVLFPFLTEAEGTKKVAWQPGTVNCLVVGNYAMIPKPFGIIIKDKDVFEEDIKDRMGTAVNLLGSDGMGMKVHFVDDWYGYHINLGEVHCGTNPESAPSSKLNWWDLAR